MAKHWLKEFVPDATIEQVDKAEEYVDSLKNELQSKTAEIEAQYKKQIEDYKSQVAAANKQINQFQSMDVEAIKKSAVDWQNTASKWEEKQKSTEKEYQEKLYQLQYEGALKDASNSLKFSSNSAKKAFMADAKARNLPYDGNKVTGFDDFVKEYQKSDPDAFVKEEPEEKGPRKLDMYSGVMGAPTFTQAKVSPDAPFGNAELANDPIYTLFYSDPKTKSSAYQIPLRDSSTRGIGDLLKRGNE
jgi:polyhydroxyalkanoate synthesis regulator phasin